MTTTMKQRQIRTSAMNGMPHPIREYLTHLGVYRFLPPEPYPAIRRTSKWVWRHTDEADSDYAQRVIAAVVGFMAGQLG